jgi:DNA-directed RNA polymerase subunit RPC12/RpoP
MKTVDHKCPSCNASINYNPKEKNWVCEYCGSKFTLEQLEENEENFKHTNVNESKELKNEREKNNKKEEKTSTEEVEMDEYYCEDCGARILADKNTAATFCVYCKNTAILKSRLTEKFSPSKIIPFAKTKDEAIEAFKKVGKGKFLMPKEFSDSKNIQEITGVYVPFWLYTCKMNGNIKGKGTKVTTWSTYDYIYTKTDTYNVERSGVYNFEKIPVDGSVRFNDAVMNSIEPFNYDDLTKFSYSYLSGFLAEKYDVEKDEAKKITIDRAKTTCLNDLETKVRSSGYNSFSPSSKETNANDEEIDYVLLPVWMLNIKYNEKFYTFAMNGQTGKMIGDIPYSKKKAFLFWLVLFIVLFAIVAFITYIF